jgi:hypothetical protein
MTLRLDEKKALIQSFGNSKLQNLQPRPNQQSLSSLMINNRDPLQDSMLREFVTFDLRFPLEYSVPEVWDQAPRILFKSTALVHFGTLAFKSFNFPHFLLPGTLLPKVNDLLTCVLPHINDCESLRLFELREFQTLCLRFLL